MKGSIIGLILGLIMCGTGLYKIYSERKKLKWTVQMYVMVLGFTLTMFIICLYHLIKLI